MDEEQLKQLLGENFDGAKDFFKNQVLGGGEYVRKEMADAEKAKLNQALQVANDKIKSKMSDEEKSAADAKAQQELIETLQAQLKAQTLKSNQSQALGNIAEATTLIGIKGDDKDFTKFIENISVEDADKTNEVSKYINKLVKDAYEKGKSEATKQNLGKMGNFNANSNNGSDDNKTESIATRLAKENNPQITKSSYFKN